MNSGRFLTGGVTFCAMVPMRSIPFDVVCLVGMNDGSFPRTRQPASFDLMADASANAATARGATTIATSSWRRSSRRAAACT